MRCDRCGGDMPELDFNDLFQISAAERMKDDDLVDAIQELGSKVLLQGMRDGVARNVGAPSAKP